MTIYGTLNESDSISPSDDKEKRYTECESCSGEGKIDFEDTNDDGIIAIEKSICMCCNGEGQIEIED